MYIVTFLFTLAIFFLGCAPKPLSVEVGSLAWGVEILWHGHSCFSLRDSTGRTLVLDPFDETVGYNRLRLKADALLVSHEHFDHNAKRFVSSLHRELDLVISTGTFNVASGLLVNGIMSFHDTHDGQINGMNRMYSFVMGGLRIAFLGDVGQDQLTEAQKALLGPVDVLFVPVGGVTTLNGSEAKGVVEALRPRVIFPMHYGNVRFYPLDPLEKFTNLFGSDQVRHVSERYIRIRQADLTEKPIVYILTPSERN